MRPLSQNPYHAPRTLETALHSSPCELTLFPIVGFWVGILAPIILGAFQLIRFHAHVAAMSKADPNMAHCGMPALAIIFLMVVAPLPSGCLAAGIGYLLALARRF